LRRKVNFELARLTGAKLDNAVATEMYVTWAYGGWAFIHPPGPGLYGTERSELNLQNPAEFSATEVNGTTKMDATWLLDRSKYGKRMEIGNYSAGWFPRI
jgi:hypothetical protein